MNLVKLPFITIETDLVFLNSLKDLPEIGILNSSAIALLIFSQ